jgi:hypothetical protein
MNILHALSETTTLKQRRDGSGGTFEYALESGLVASKQNPKQLGAVSPRGNSQLSSVSAKNADKCVSSQYYTNAKLVREGFELAQHSSNCDTSGVCAAIIDALEANSFHVDAGLMEIITAWIVMEPKGREIVLLTVRAHTESCKKCEQQDS